MNKYKNSRQAIKLPLYIAVAMCVGIFIGAKTVGGGTTFSPGVEKGLQKFRRVLTYIDNDYVDRVDTDELVESAISSMLKTLDPHSVYIPPKELDMVQSQLNGNYEGIGVEFNIFNDTIFVVSPISGGPSEALGIRTGDKIIRVDGETVAGIGIDNRGVIDRLRGKKGSEVTVSVLRKGERNVIDFVIGRDVIPQFSVDVAYMIDDNIGYLKVSRFANETFTEFKEALHTLQQEGMEKMILDLTGNPGGYLQVAVRMVDELLAGRRLIVYTDGKKSRYSETHFSGVKGDFEQGAVIVLIDEGSASASEIVAGAIQDHDRGSIVGRRSFGKGLVQLPIDLSDHSQLRLTISRYYTPSGRSIQKSYKGKSEDDYHEAHDRYEKGELYASDSIEVNDSMTYKTAKGRVVYGGGGITPDHFVPLDTSQNTDYLNGLFSTRSLQEYTVKFVEENKDRLEEMGREQYIASFHVSDEMLQELVVKATKNGHSFEKTEFLRSKELIRLLTKAYIARGIWDNRGFYPVFNRQNEIYLKAIDLMSNAEKPK